MFRNQYDTDVVTWSPQGRIHQIEYAMEAVKQGAAAVGLRSDTHVILASLKRASSELSSHSRKVFKIDDHLGIATAGLAADGRILCRYMRNECINHRFVYESPMPTGRLVRQIADRAQVATQRSWKRPYGVGLLVGGYDKSGSRLFYNCPSGNYYEYKAFGIGARSQAAKTYLERTFETYASASKEQLIGHALKALSASLSDGELKKENCMVALVGKDQAFTILEDDVLEPFIEAFKAEEGAGDGAGDEQPPAAAGDGAAAADEGDGAAPMDT